jgi:hypothetical protein
LSFLRSDLHGETQKCERKNEEGMREQKTSGKTGKEMGENG